MENAEEILQCLDEFSKLKPKDIPRELEDYMCFVAKTGDPVYQWSQIKCLFREKLISVITEFYEACPSVDIPPCPNVDSFNYDATKSFILEKLDTFAAAPFTVQRICELLTCPRKEYNRIDKYMRALEKNILVVSTREPGNRKSTENGESVVNGLESEHVSAEINVEVEMADETAVWPKNIDTPMSVAYGVTDTSSIVMETQPTQPSPAAVATDSSVQDQPPPSTTEAETLATCSSSIETVITSRPIGYIGELIIEPAAATDTSTSEPAAQPAAAAAAAAAEEQSTAGKEEPSAFVAAAEQPEQPYASVIQLEPEPTAVQVDQPPEKPSDAVSSDEPEPSDAGSEAQPSAETSSSAAPPEHAAAVDSSGETAEPQPSSAVQDAEEPSSSAAEALEPSPTSSSSEETVISSTDEPESSNSTPAAAESCPGSSDSMPAASEIQNAAPGSSDSTPSASESCPGSSDSTPSAAEESCNQVSESNQADCIVSQTDSSVIEATPSPGVETTSATVAESTGEESMDVDEPSVPVEVTEVSTNQQTDTTEAAAAAAVSNN